MDASLVWARGDWSAVVFPFSCSLLPRNGSLDCMAVLILLNAPRLGSGSGSVRVESLELEGICSRGLSSLTGGKGALSRCVEALGCWATDRSALEEGIRRMPILACRTPTAGRRCEWELDWALTAADNELCQHGKSPFYSIHNVFVLTYGTPRTRDHCILTAWARERPHRCSIATK